MLKFIYNKLEIYNINKTIFVSFLLVIGIGFLTFLSASVGILNRNEIKFYGIIESQFYSYIIGFFMMFVFYILPQKIIEKLSVFAFVSSVLLCFLVFVPQIGVSHGGATRWLDVAGFSLQPSEILKLATIFICSYAIKKYNNQMHDIKKLLLIFGSISLPIFVSLFLQKDLGSLLIIMSIIGVMLFNSKTRVTHLFSIVAIGIIAVSVYVMNNDYVKSRIMDYFGASTNSQGISYQNNQALISIGVGGFLGKGFGQSVQKFYYLPEPTGDSIFAVYAEEFGFAGSALLISVFAFLITRILLFSIKVKDMFIKNVLVGVSTLFFLQIFLNIGSMVKIIPLSGDVLPFFSQGGTSLICNFILLGIILQFTKSNNIKTV